ncbi:hypothetical protein [Lysinibacillus sp. FSL P4-0201]|uniref:hypothetical protein n=1 Tax=Lysinibacillus sp. FSL P4-0201 TaxID=2921721 RepID=UPI00315AE2D5
MKITNGKLLKAIFDFSDFFNVTPPWSDNIVHWWSKVVYELQEQDVCLLYFALKGALENKLGNDEIVSKLFHELEKRKLQINQSVYVI